MKKLQTKKEVHALAILFAATYMVSYMTRINYGAIISEMEIATQTSKTLLSMALTGSFVTYGLGQIVSGICGDRFSPKKLVTYGFVITSAMNLLIPFCQDPYQMLAVWSLNGFAQAFMWPPMIRILTALLTDEDYKSAIAKTSWGSSIGTMLIYLLSPLIISLFGWQWVFRFSALCGIVMIFVWNKYSYEVTEPRGNTPIQPKQPATRGLFTPVMLAIMLAIVLQGMLRDGVTTWMPSYISETYQISNLISILTGVILPIFSILCYQIVTRLYRKKLTNPLLCAGVLYGAGAVSSLALYLFTGQNAAFSVVLSAILIGCMHGVNLMLICMLPPFFTRYGNVSTASGVLNSCTYIGSALSTYGIALLSEQIGWRSTLLVWLLIAVAGTVICLLCVRPWRKQFPAVQSNKN